MTLIERILDPKLAIIAGDNCWALPEARTDDCLDTRRRLDLRELRGHVAVGRTVGLLVRDSDARFWRHSDALIAHRFAKGIGARNQSHSRKLATLEIIEDFFTRHPVGMRSLEDPLAHRLDDLHRARQYRNHCQCGASRRSADHGGDFVFFDEARGKSARRIGIAAVVIDDQLKLLAVNPTLAVYVFDIQVQRFSLWIAEERCWAAGGEDCTDLDLGCGRPSGPGHCETNQQSSNRDLLHHRRTLPMNWQNPRLSHAEHCRARHSRHWPSVRSYMAMALFPPCFKSSPPSSGGFRIDLHQNVPVPALRFPSPRSIKDFNNYRCCQVELSDPS